MNLRPAFFVASLLANAALVAVLLLRPSSPFTASSAPGTTPAGHATPKGAGPIDAVALQAALASGDRATLLAAGVSEDVARIVGLGRAFDLYQAKVRAVRPLTPSDGRYWRRDTGLNPSSMSKEQRLELSKAQRDFSEAVRVAVGEDLEALFGGRDSGNTYLPVAKRERLRRIEQDYAEMQAQVNADQQDGIQLPADREKLRLLNLEKNRDIAAALSPEEREQYELRNSPSAMTIRARYGDAIQSEEDYRKIYALQKAFDDQYPSPDQIAGGLTSPEAQRARRDAEQQLQADIRAAIPPDHLAAFQHANDQDVKTLNSLASRLNLPATTADTVLGARESYATRSMEINADAALSGAERRTQLQALATKAQAELQATLGSDGAQVYAQRAQWMSWLKNGQAFSTNPKDAPAGSFYLNTAVYPVQPPRPATPPAGATPRG